MTQHSTHTRDEAIRMHAQGMSFREISKVLNVPFGTLSGWLSNMPKAKRKGSGVIAPKPYAVGFRWGLRGML